MATDIIIIGAGIMGLSTAWQIARRSTLNIAVLEKASSLGEGSTGASSAICRHRYSRDEMIELARDGIAAYRNWSAFTGLTGPEAGYHNDGVLWVNANGGSWAEKERDRLQRHDIGAEVISHVDIRQRFPDLSACITPPDLETGEPHECEHSGQFLFETDGGYFEPVDALNDLARAAGRAGVDIQLQTPVSSLVITGGRTRGVKLEDGRVIDAPVVINTSGPWCNDILTTVGLADRWPLKATRIQVMHINRPTTLTGKIPVCCDQVGGVYFREQNRGQQIVVGSAREEDEREVVDPSDYNDWIDDDFKASRLHALQHRIPALTESIRVMGYTGLYTVNQRDVHPVVGESGIDGFHVANGFSGHGFKIAPAVGSLLAQQITGNSVDFDTGIDPGFLAFDREPIQVDAKNVLA